MATATRVEGPILLSSYRRHRARARGDRWVATMMAVLAIAMLAGLARRVDARAIAAGERAPAVLLD